MYGDYVLCSVTLGFPFFEGVARAFSVIVACGRECVCVALTAKNCCALCGCAFVFVAKLGLVENQRNGTQDEPGDKLTTQLPETMRHMPELQVKIKITQEQSPRHPTIIFT